MALAVLVLLGGLAVSRTRGGSLRRLSEAPLRWRRLLVAALAAELLGSLLALSGSRAAYDAGLAGCAVLVLGFCAVNRRVPGAALLAAGLAANALVVALNGAMPVSKSAAERAGASLRSVATGGDPRHELAGHASRLAWLGDVVPVALPGWRQVDSPGDLLVAAGLAEFVVVSAGGRPRRRRPPRGPAMAGWVHGEEEAQAPGSGEERRQPRQATQLLTD